MSLVRTADARRTQTPNGVMTTLASPTVGGARHSLWRVEMAAGASGPEHRCDAEQVLTVLSGRASLTVDGAPLELGAGDTAVVRAGAGRRLAAPEAVVLLVSAAPTANAVLPDGTDRGRLPWAA